MLIKLVKGTGEDVLEQIDCPEKDVKKLIGIFELFDKSVKDIKIGGKNG